MIGILILISEKLILNPFLMIKKHKNNSAIKVKLITF